MSSKKYNIFISYRRQGAEFFVNNLQKSLNSEGYNAFYDIQEMHEGNFDEQLFSRIDECKDFIIVLPPDGLKRCRNKDDWVRREIAYALKRRKNIIPVTLPGFEWPEKDFLPPDISDFQRKESVSISLVHVNEDINKILNFLHAKPTKKYVSIFIKISVAILVLTLMATTAYLLINNNEEKIDEIKWKKAYQLRIQQLIDDLATENGGNLSIEGVYVVDSDSDGVPTVAISYVTYQKNRTPQLILNYKNNSLVELSVPATGSGDAYVNNFYFTDKSDMLINTVFGAYESNFASGSLIVWEPKDTEYSISFNKVYDLFDDSKKKYGDDSYSTWMYYSLFVKEKLQELVSEDIKANGLKNHNLYSFADVMITHNTISYLENMLGITLEYTDVQNRTLPKTNQYYPYYSDILTDIISSEKHSSEFLKEIPIDSVEVKDVKFSINDLNNDEIKELILFLPETLKQKDSIYILSYSMNQGKVVSVGNFPAGTKFYKNGCAVKESFDENYFEIFDCINYNGKEYSNPIYINIVDNNMTDVFNISFDTDNNGKYYSHYINSSNEDVEIRYFDDDVLEEILSFYAPSNEKIKIIPFELSEENIQKLF